MLDDPSEEGMNRIRATLDETNAELRRKKAELKEQADWLARILASDPVRFCEVLGIETEMQYIQQRARLEAEETRLLKAIKDARLRREAENG